MAMAAVFEETSEEFEAAFALVTPPPEWYSAPGSDAPGIRPASPSNDDAVANARRRAAAELLLREPGWLEKLAGRLIVRHERLDAAALDVRQSLAVGRWVCKQLHDCVPSDEELYLELTMRDAGGTNLFGCEALTGFLRRLLSNSVGTPCKLSCAKSSRSSSSSSSRSTTASSSPPPSLPPSPSTCAGEATEEEEVWKQDVDLDLEEFEGEVSCARTTVAAAPPQTAESPNDLGDWPTEDSAPEEDADAEFPVVLRTLSGESQPVRLSRGGTLKELGEAVNASPLPIAGGQHRFSLAGRVLSSRASLQEQGLAAGAVVNVVRIRPPPLLVRLECKGLSLGPSIRGSCGTFRRTSAVKNDRPVYVRDLDLSQWNSAMKYHGSGSRYLVFEEHVTRGGRWAVTDSQDWPGYVDRAYAYIADDCPHPAGLEGRLWHIYRDARWSVEREWVEHDSLALTVEEE